MELLHVKTTLQSRETAELIEDIKDLSDHWIKRVRFIFKNGHQLSVIRGEFSYGGAEELFEIMPIMGQDFNGKVLDDDGELLDGEVLGYLTEEKVRYYI